MRELGAILCSIPCADAKFCYLEVMLANLLALCVCRSASSVPRRFFNDDVLMLKLAGEDGNSRSASGPAGNEAPACLGIFDKEPRAAQAQRADGGRSDNRPSMRVSLYTCCDNGFQSPFANRCVSEATGCVRIE